MRRFQNRRAVLSLCLVVSLVAGGASRILGLCGPFTDVTDAIFCPFVLEIFYLGITTGTTATTYDPTGNVSRLQMAAFLSRTVDGTLRRGSRRAPLEQNWNSQSFFASLSVTTVGSAPIGVQCDGLDVWVSNNNSNSVSRVRASDGRLLETWTGLEFPDGVLSCLGRIFVTGNGTPGKLFSIDPSQPAGSALAVATLGDISQGVAFDGARIWTANGGGGSVSIVTPGSAPPWTVTTVTSGFNAPNGLVFDGSNVWVADNGAGTLLKLSSSGAILLTVTVGTSPQRPVYDGANIWVPNFSDNSATVVHASNGIVLATLTGNGLTGARVAAFDGQRVLITGYAGNTVSLWKAADLTAIGNVSTGASTSPAGAASDGINFWVALSNASANKLARF